MGKPTVISRSAALNLKQRLPEKDVIVLDAEYGAKEKHLKGKENTQLDDERTGGEVEVLVDDGKKELDTTKRTKESSSEHDVEDKHL